MMASAFRSYAVSRADLHRFVYETGSSFKRLDALLKGIAPNPDLTPINMTIGEPRHTPPEGVGHAVGSTSGGFGTYPPITGSLNLRTAIARWITRRYGLPTDAITPERNVVALNGSREGLVFACRTARDVRLDIDRPVVVMQNPFYLAYIAGALMADVDVHLLDDTDLTGDGVDEDIWERTVAAYIASPTNPQGEVLSQAQWASWIERARRHNFILFADECYSEIYREAPPVGGLEAAWTMNGSLDKVVSFNSLSKRSNLPGLRSGFMAGDPGFIETCTKLRNIGGPQVPLPLQEASVQVWSDETHVEASRALYRHKWQRVADVLGDFLDEPVPEAGFFLWLKVPKGATDIELSTKLWREQALRTIPGSYLAYSVTPGHGSDRIRIALVGSAEETDEALRRLAITLADYRSRNTTSHHVTD